MIQIADSRYILRIILVKILFLNVINAEFRAYYNATEHNPTRTSERLKRAPFHRYIPSPVLTATIIDGDEEIHLRWERVDRYLFNENLPVYTVRMDSWGATHRKAEGMKRIGKTILYYDVVQKSSLIYLEEADKLHGVVGQSYEITSLPIDELSKPLIVGETFVRRLMNYRIHKAKLETKTKKIDSGEARSDSSRCRKKPEAEHFYVETLLFITYDIFKLVYDVSGYLAVERIVINSLLYLEAVDMIFAVLPTNEFGIYINLAGIIIEEEDGAFGEILGNPSLKYGDRIELHNDGSMFNIFEKYPKHFDFPFAKDSFDLMLILTSRHLVYQQVRHHAWNSVVKDIFWERQLNNPHSPVPSIMIQMSDAYSQYPVVAYYIGNTLGLAETIPCNEDSITEDRVQCYSIMQRLSRYCTNCLTWNDKSITQLKTFLSENSNRCFLLNKPRSLYPAGTPVISVPPCRQCSCFGFHSYARESENECPFYIQPQDCGEPLLCNRQHGRGHQIVEESILPFDGTPCGENKVCWNEVCTSLSDATSKSRA